MTLVSGGCYAFSVLCVCLKFFRKELTWSQSGQAGAFCLARQPGRAPEAPLSKSGSEFTFTVAALPHQRPCWWPHVPSAQPRAWHTTGV